MINRELIRIKVVQLTYAYYQNGEKNMDNAEKELLFSLSKSYHLYNYLLYLIVAASREERHRVDIAIQRAEREGTEKPSEKFVNNKFALQLEEKKMLNFDLVISFDEKNPEALANQIKEAYSKLYPEYHCFIQIDQDIAG